MAQPFDMLANAVLKPGMANRGFGGSRRPFLDHHRGHGGDILSAIGKRLGIGDGLPFGINLDHAAPSLPPQMAPSAARQRPQGERGFMGMLGQAMMDPNKSYFDVRREYDQQRQAANGRNASIEALRAEGAPENWLKAAEYNPKVMETLVTRYLAKSEEPDFTGMVSSEDFAWSPDAANGEQPENKTVTMLRGLGYEDAQIEGVLRLAANGNLKPLNHMLKQGITSIGQGASWQFKEVGDGKGGTKLVAINPKNPRQVMELGLAGAKKQPLVNIDNSTPNASAQKLRDELGKTTGKSWGEIQEAARMASVAEADLSTLDALVDQVPSGTLSGRWAQMFPEFDDSAAVFQATIKRLAPTMRVEGSGSTSDIEVKMMVDSLPSLVNNPAANRAIIQAMKAKNQLNKQMADIIYQYQFGDNEGKTLSLQEAGRRLRQLQSQSIMTPELKAQLNGLTAQAPTQPSTPAAQVPAGVDPADWQHMTPEERALFQ